MTKKNAAPAPTAGPRKETLEFAAKVVKLRDTDGLAWKAVAAKLKVPYDQNGSSRLRRAYILGKGKTVGVRSAAPAKKATARKPRATKKATAPAGTRSRRQRGTEKGLVV